ncbi:cysteine proteinase [Backusella circina FSU 941]|nr:cysteine proteinase [Backusella circina FSU 941]
MADSLPEPKAASTKKNKERSVPIDPEKEVLTYPFNGKQAITIKEGDIRRVENNKFLNDTVIDAYPKMLQAQHQRNSIHVFSSLFFTRLTQSDESSPRRQTTAIKYEKVKRWTDKVNLFEKKHIVVPIEQAHHWILTIFLFLKKKNRSYVTILDSLGGDRKVVYEQVCKYLKAEATTRLDIDRKDFKEPKYVKACVPQQPNLIDCGVYFLYYLKRLFEDPKKVKQALVSSNPKYEDTWVSGQVQFFRRRLVNILRAKAKEYEAYKKEKLMKK